MTSVIKDAFIDELEKIAMEKDAFDPSMIHHVLPALHQAGHYIASHKGPITEGLVGAKFTAAHILERHGSKIPGVNKAIDWAGKKIIGRGLSSGSAGKKILNRPVREAAAVIAPGAVKAYEHAHAAGKALGPRGLEAAKESLHRATSTPAFNDLKKIHPQIARATEFLKNIPTNSPTLSRVPPR